MGNYLQSLRVPPQASAEREHERHHPLYYDWSQAKWSPFRDDHPSATKHLNCSSSQGSNLAAAAAAAAEITATDRNHKEANKTLPPVAGSGSAGSTSSGGGGKSAAKTAKQAIQKSLKSTLTSAVDLANSKPANAHKTNAAKKTNGGAGGSGGKSTGSGAANHKAAPREAAHAASSMRKSSDGQSAARNKKVDSTRPQTIDPARDGGIDKQAALKAATNIHTVDGPTVSTTRKRVTPAS